jgi:RNA polymerase sigma factor (TIGR02999 family)
LSADPALRARTTAWLLAADYEDPDALEHVLPLLYDELRKMAHRQLARERGNHTLQTTALVHEAYLRLVDQARVTERGQAYFFAAAARAMRRVLVDYARRRTAKKRGAGKAPLSLEENQIAVDMYADGLIDLDGALERLAVLNPKYARVVECRFFAGLSVKETAEALQVSYRTVENYWALARAWLHDALRDEPGERG